jgi:hypothetical protein
VHVNSLTWRSYIAGSFDILVDGPVVTAAAAPQPTDVTIANMDDNTTPSHNVVFDESTRKLYT